MGNDESHMKECQNCGLRYDWRRSPSSYLKMTYCGSICEKRHLGFTIDAALHITKRPSPIFEEAA